MQWPPGIYSCLGLHSPAAPASHGVLRPEEAQAPTGPAGQEAEGHQHLRTDLEKVKWKGPALSSPRSEGTHAAVHNWSSRHFWSQHREVLPFLEPATLGEQRPLEQRPGLCCPLFRGVRPPVPGVLKRWGESFIFIKFLNNNFKNENKPGGRVRS